MTHAFDADWLRAAGGNPQDLPLWEAWRDEGRLLLHRCGVCDRHYWPASLCVEHGGDAMEWVEASGKGSVHVWTMFHRHYSPQDRHLPLPYNVAVVKLEEGCFFHSRILDCSPEGLHSGLEVTLVPREPGEMPMFRPASDN